MLCSSCGVDVPPQFKKIISTNVCPECGGEIVNEPMRELLNELSDALKSMPNDPEGIAGWLLSHYELRKVGTGKPVINFHGNRPNVVASPVVPNDTTKFFKNAGISPKTRAEINAAKINGEIVEEDLYDEPLTAEDILFQQNASNAFIEGGRHAAKAKAQAVMRNTANEFSEIFADGDATQMDLPEPKNAQEARDLNRFNEERMRRLEAQQALANGGVTVNSKGKESIVRRR